MGSVETIVSNMYCEIGNVPFLVHVQLQMRIRDAVCVSIGFIKKLREFRGSVLPIASRPLAFQLIILSLLLLVLGVWLLKGSDEIIWRTSRLLKWVWGV